MTPRVSGGAPIEALAGIETAGSEADWGACDAAEGRRDRAPSLPAMDQQFEHTAVTIDAGAIRGHEVSILIVIGVVVGRYRGVEPRSNVSMIIMRPPQHGHGWGGWSVAAALSGACCLCAVCAGFAAAISSRARAMVWALVPLASRP